MEDIGTEFEKWWEKEGSGIYVGAIERFSVHNACKALALAAFESALSIAATEAVVMLENSDIPGAPVHIHGLSISDGAPVPGDVEPAAPASVEPSALVQCGACQNCGLENLAEPENAPVECSGCKYVGQLSGIFSRPAV